MSDYLFIIDIFFSSFLFQINHLFGHTTIDDDILSIDEERQKETLRFLMELGKEQQIFLFTCHEPGA